MQRWDEDTDIFCDAGERDLLALNFFAGEVRRLLRLSREVLVALSQDGRIRLCHHDIISNCVIHGRLSVVCGLTRNCAECRRLTWHSSLTGNTSRRTTGDMSMISGMRRSARSGVAGDLKHGDLGGTGQQ